VNEVLMSDYQSIVTEVDGGVGILTLNKAQRHNAFDEQLIAEITAGLRELDADAEVRVVVLSSTGKSFCAGADLNWMRAAAATRRRKTCATRSAWPSSCRPSTNSRSRRLRACRDLPTAVASA
jgi:enoyl-CoA hydratase/carnithine racemase